MQADQNGQFTERNQFSDRRHNPGTYRHNLIEEQENQMADDSNYNYNIDDESEDQNQ